ncbi:MAG: YceI family protein [Terricaulis sp.]|nr:YceI family protein [Terricaulis sp.]
MIPGLRALDGSAPPPKNPQRLAVLGVGLGLAGIALAAALFAVSGYVAAASAPQHQSSVEIAEPAAPPVEDTATETAEAAPAAPAEPGAPPAWRVDAGASAVNFTYVYSDESGETPMNGRFTRWRADIRFDPENLPASRANVAIETASVNTAVAYHNNTLATAAWFNSAANPSATFVTREIVARGNGYEARGDLTIKGVTRRVALPFTLAIEGDRATMEGSLSIARADFGIGAGAEGDDMIGPNVTIKSA